MDDKDQKRILDPEIEDEDEMWEGLLYLDDQPDLLDQPADELSLDQDEEPTADEMRHPSTPVEPGPEALDGFEDDAITLYFRDVGEIPLLTAEEEQDLAREIARGRWARQEMEDANDLEERARLMTLVEAGERARKRLTQANSRLVISLAKRYLGHGVPFSDLIQEGNLGLMRAVEKFDYRRGHKFSTYATWWIRQALTRAVADQGRTIRVPVHMSDRVWRLRRVSRLLEQKLGRKPTIEEIAEETGLPSQRVQWLLKVSQQPMSLEKPVGDDEDDDRQFQDYVANEDTPDPADMAARQLLREQIEAMLTSLTPREARVLQLRYGLVDGRFYTLKEVGEKFGLTRERIRQIETEALHRLRHPRRSQKLEDYLA